MASETQKKLIIMLHELRGVLLSAKVPFFLIGGSAIGALREHDIIPWDDDVDVGIKRDHIPQFLTAVQHSDLMKRYKLIIPGQTPNYYFPTYKLLWDLSGTDAPKDAGTGFQGVFIDVFALDKTYTSKPRRRLHQLQIRLDQIRLDIAMGHPESGTKLGPLHKILVRQAAKHSKSQLLTHYLRDIQKHQGLTKGYMYYNFGSPYAWDRETYHVDEVASAVMRSFAGEQYPIAVGYDTILTRMYGDYMQPPAQSKRQPKHLS
ncbi:LicD family protein [Schleiferilactobacillus perolens]|jgi:lipopolysaccharide cholinephosphotransferase|uniref:LicD family protein n=1 Tax=Schleiferilactobacillus perolens TaxID=100468 RepID=UPI0023570581|nr:LicD family protein [Schleiferilactobacillus perolens]MCI2171110.1 LicD family protein [Schleiferilactobacillus perolens]